METVFQFIWADAAVFLAPCVPYALALVGLALLASGTQTLFSLPSLIQLPGLKLRIFGVASLNIFSLISLLGIGRQMQEAPLSAFGAQDVLKGSILLVVFIWTKVHLGKTGEAARSQRESELLKKFDPPPQNLLGSPTSQTSGVVSKTNRSVVKYYG